MLSKGGKLALQNIGPRSSVHLKAQLGKLEEKEIHPGRNYVFMLKRGGGISSAFAHWTGGVGGVTETAFTATALEKGLIQGDRCSKKQKRNDARGRHCQGRAILR